MAEEPVYNDGGKTFKSLGINAQKVSAPQDGFEKTPTHARNEDTGEVVEVFRSGNDVIADFPEPASRWSWGILE